MPRDGGEPRRSDAAALAAVGGSAKLARRDARLEVRRHAPRRPREDTLVGRLRRIRIDVDEAFRRGQLRVAQAERQ